MMKFQVHYFPSFLLIRISLNLQLCIRVPEGVYWRRVWESEVGIRIFVKRWYFQKYVPCSCAHGNFVSQLIRYATACLKNTFPDYGNFISQLIRNATTCSKYDGLNDHYVTDDWQEMYSFTFTPYNPWNRQTKFFGWYGDLKRITLRFLYFYLLFFYGVKGKRTVR